ncbi:hypothetical protein BJX63DRAFT_408618 [Aspergillus granulosus]|uniref:Uncharacterized protein n=1 Tax=Aspergillus granulosus TaxID=176169 RepID=A0ABR4H046_9EURO
MPSCNRRSAPCYIVMICAGYSIKMAIGAGASRNLIHELLRLPGFASRTLRSGFSPSTRALFYLVYFGMA